MPSPPTLGNASAVSAPTAVAPLPLAADLAACTAVAAELAGSVCSSTVQPFLLAGQSLLKVSSAAVVPPEPPVATLITCGVEARLDPAPERPISTPTPIASSSTPIPASRLTVPPRGAGGSAPAGGAKPGGTGGEACRGGPERRNSLTVARRSPHSRQ